MNILLQLEKPKELYSIYNKLCLALNQNPEEVLRIKIKEYLFKEFPNLYSNVKKDEITIPDNTLKLYNEILEKYRVKAFKAKIDGLI